MQQTSLLIHNDVGLHARPAAQFVKTAKQFKSTVTINHNGKTVNAKSLVLLLSLAIPKDAEVEVKVDGEDEQEAVQAIKALVERNFGES